MSRYSGIFNEVLIECSEAKEMQISEINMFTEEKLLYF